MKVVVTKDFGTAKKPVLPLVPETTAVLKKEDLAQVDLFSDPADVNSTKVKFAFKMLEGGTETAREIIQWMQNVERAFIGLNSTTGTLRKQMMQQFARGSALSGFNAAVTQLAPPTRATAVATAQAAVDADDGTDVARAGRLAANLAAMQALTDETVLALPGLGTAITDTAIQEMVTVLLPTKILQRVKRHLRREARKPVDMGIRTYLMHIIRINSQEITRLPPHFNDAQMLSEDEIIDILLFGTPKSWQREMDRQGFDPLAVTPADVVAFMERIEMSEDFDADKKVAKVNQGKGKKKTNFAKGNSDADGSKCCMLHGNNNTHDTSECKTLMAQAKKLKGNNGANNKGKAGNKSWKNKSKDATDDSKKELAALIKKATEVIKKSELNAIEPVKKRKVNWPSEEEEAELCALDAELKDFNYEDMDKMDMGKLVIKDPEDGEVDDDSVTDEVSV